jgi:hypothetical protein
MACLYLHIRAFCALLCGARMCARVQYKKYCERTCGNMFTAILCTYFTFVADRNLV